MIEGDGGLDQGAGGAEVSQRGARSCWDAHTLLAECRMAQPL